MIYSQVTPLKPYDSSVLRPTASNHMKLGAAIAYRRSWHVNTLAARMLLVPNQLRPAPILAHTWKGCKFAFTSNMLMYKRYVDCWSIVCFGSCDLYKLQIKRAHLSLPQKDVLKMLKAKKDSTLETGMAKTCKLSCVRNKLGSLGQA